MRKYEFMYIVDPALDEQAAQKSLEKYAGFIRERGGEVTHQQIWGRRKFAYEINKKNEGTYLLIRMRMEPAVVEELNRALRFDESVLRSLVVKDEDWERRNAEARQRRARAEAPAAEGGTA